MTQTVTDVELFDDETLNEANTVQEEDDDPAALAGEEVEDDLGLDKVVN
jgi:hypothetical protein